MLRRLAEGLRPHVWLNVHSGMDALFMPYDHQARIPGVRRAGGQCPAGRLGRWLELAFPFALARQLLLAGWLARGVASWLACSPGCAGRGGWLAGWAAGQLACSLQE